MISLKFCVIGATKTLSKVIFTACDQSLFQQNELENTKSDEVIVKIRVHLECILFAYVVIGSKHGFSSLTRQT